MEQTAVGRRGGPARVRRSSSEVRELVLAAATRCFAERPYPSVTVREIARTAGVTEPMVFRHFGSKAALFEAAALHPFLGYIDEFVQTWGSNVDVADPPLLARRYVRGLLALCETNRDLLAAVAGGLHGTDGKEVADRLADGLRLSLSALTARIEQYYGEVGLPRRVRTDPVVRFTIAVIVGSVLLRDSLFGDLDSDTLGNELGDFLVRASGQEPAHLS